VSFHWIGICAERRLCPPYAKLREQMFRAKKKNPRAKPGGSQLVEDEGA
jgi:hypothetical protein